MRRSLQKNWVRLEPLKQGFTLVEVLIAGVLMTTIMVAVARLSTQAMAGSNTQKDRQAIEAAINDNIQLIQQADSQITVTRLNNESDGILDNTNLEQACGNGTINNNPASFLIQQIHDGDMAVASPSLTTRQINYNISRKLSVLPIGNSFMAEILFTFDGPEQGVRSESRVIEISPSFESGCYQ
jgi:type II secretory pathway pseudopilin PulG